MEWTATFPKPHSDKTCPVCSTVAHTEAYLRGIAEAQKNAAIARGEG